MEGLLIPNITNAPYQQFIVITEDGNQFNLTLQYLEQQQSWFYSLYYPTTSFILNGRRLTTGNCLLNYKNQLPFGLICESLDGADPVFIDDFIPVNPNNQFSSRIQLYSLSKIQNDAMNLVFSPNHKIN